MTARRSMSLVCDGYFNECHSTAEFNLTDTPRQRRAKAAKLGWSAYGRGRNHSDLCPACTEERRRYA